jgi:hypothetical protein
VEIGIVEVLSLLPGLGDAESECVQGIVVAHAEQRIRSAYGDEKPSVMRTAASASRSSV